MFSLDCDIDSLGFFHLQDVVVVFFCLVLFATRLYPDVFQPVQRATSCAPRASAWRRADDVTGWMTARTRATRFSAVSRLKALHNAAGQAMKSLFVPNLKLRLLWLAALRHRATLGKIVHLLAVRPAKKCGGDSPLHPLFVCNGEADCVDARDEVNCTRGANARSTINQFQRSAWMDALMDGCPLTLHPKSHQKQPALRSDTSAAAAPAS